MPVTVDDVLGPAMARRLPGYELRTGQLEMARAVAAAIEGDRHLFVEAGTGTGKTFAYLVPAILSGRKVVISTATHALEEQIFEKDVPFVRDLLADYGVPVRVALMKGLANYVCKRRLTERMRSGEPVTAELAAIEHWALGSQGGDRSELTTMGDASVAWRDVHSGTDTRIGAGCKYYDECFVTRMRREAEAAQIVVVNHHLFFADLALKKGAGFGGAIPPYDAVVFDEAHQIENVATDFFGVRVSSSRIDRLLRDARRAVVSARVLDAAALRILDGVESAARDFFASWRSMRTTTEEPRRLLSPSEWSDVRRGTTGSLSGALQSLMLFAMDQVESDALAMVARRAGELRSDLARIEDASASTRHWVPDEEVEDPRRGLLSAKAASGFVGGITWIDVRDRSVSLGASPVDLGPLLREHLFERIPSVVCTSATLATATHAGPSFHFAKGRLGAPPDTTELFVPSPFAFETCAALYVADDLPEPGAPMFEEASAERARELAAITGGGAFVLCTSNRAMRAFHLALSRDRPVLVQGEAPKHVLLDRFRAEGDAILVATMSFWEGVDVPGRALRLVVLDKIPFAVPSDPVVAARSAKIEVEGGNPFTQYAVPAAAITLKQGFGRLLRSSQDAGIVALLDRRAAKRGYGRALLESLPPARRMPTLDAVRDFWQSIVTSTERHRP
jgi:ATP-dependent DNA helicase DinG